MKTTYHLIVIFAITSVAHAVTGASDTVLIPGGKFTPLFGFGKQSARREYVVNSFRVDKFPVTRKKFKTFVTRNPQWSKQKIDPLYSDENYLRDFDTGPLDRATKIKRSSAKANFGGYPITYVSWFAAQAFCESMGGRLPTVLEWEYIASASALKADASRDPEFVESILRWYSTPSGNHANKPVGTSAPNYYGVYDLHGLIWEWTMDFNSVFVSGDNRQDGDKSTAAVCGAGPTNASNRSDYAAFMRYAMRSSVEARFAQPNQGFRCAYDKVTK